MKRRNIEQTALFRPLKRRATSEISRVASQFHSPSPALFFPLLSSLVQAAAWLVVVGSRGYSLPDRHRVE